MARCRSDQSIERQQINGFTFPLGVYPVEPMTPIEGYTLAFEPADADDDEEDERRPGEREDFEERSPFEPEFEAPSGYSQRGYGAGEFNPDDEDRPRDDDDLGAAGDDDRDESGLSNSEKFEAIFGPGAGDDVEPWPDRYVFDIAIRADRKSVV